jgi:hypothetical protein
MAKTSSDQSRESTATDALPGNGLDAAQPALSPQALERARLEASQLFRHANLDHPVMQALQQLCIKRRARALSGEN